VGRILAKEKSHQFLTGVFLVFFKGKNRIRPDEVQNFHNVIKLSGNSSSSIG
jgi:hypothetical protein